MIDLDRLAPLDGRPGPRPARASRSSTASSPAARRTRSTRSAAATCTARCASRRRPRRRAATTGIVREWRIIEALDGTDVPHTRGDRRVHATPSVLGRAFYLMGFVDGWSPMGLIDKQWPAPFDTDLDARKGPGVPAGRGHRAARQGRLAGQGARATSAAPTASTSARSTGGPRSSSASRAASSPASTRPPAWLRAHKPIDFIPGLMHGDYQFANVMYQHGAPARLAAIVDWEMGTVGDPKLDLGWVVQQLARGHRRAGDGDRRGYVDMQRMPTARRGARALRRGVGPPGRRHRLLRACSPSGSSRSCSSRASSARGDDEKLNAFGPIVLDLMKGAADLAETHGLRADEPTTEDELVVERRGAVLVLRLNRPEARNALTPSLIGELGAELLAEAEADPERAGDRAHRHGRPGVLRGHGPARVRGRRRARRRRRRAMPGVHAG